MTRQIKVYTASKTTHAAKWLALRAEWPEVHFTARWPSMVVAGVPEAAYSAMQFWQDDLADVKASDVVLVYAERMDLPMSPWEHLRGALVEAGMGLALGKRIIVIGDSPDYGTWQHHPLCFQAEDLQDARGTLSRLREELNW